ncbi:MAG: ABC transporter substrate-binding protein [Vicinamibacterales bacterium]
MNVRHLALILLLLGIIASATAGGQVPARMPVVGVLSPGSVGDANAAASREAFERGLKEFGWVSGLTFLWVYGYGVGARTRLQGLARELVQLGVDVVVARASTSVAAARQATATIPIVMSASGEDPVQTGVIASLARPGGNVTGLTLLLPDLRLKQLQLLKEVVPGLSRVAVVTGSSVPTEKDRQNLDTAAVSLGLHIEHVDVRQARDLNTVFASLARARIDGLLVWGDPLVLEANMQEVVGLASKHRLPAVYWLRAYPERGGLMSYGADLLEIHRRSAYYVDRLLRGTRPSDLPVEAPTKFALVVNVKSAKAIGLSFPRSILARADEVIE